MDSAQTLNSVNEHVAFVEECQCPAGYTGLSCEVSVKYIINTIKCLKNIYQINYILYFNTYLIFPKCSL